MKMMVHRTAISEANPFDIDAVKAYLRIIENDEDISIENIAHAAAAEIEHFAQIALLTQTIQVTIFDPGPLTGVGLTLPIGPVAVNAVPSITVDGQDFTAFEFAGGPRGHIHWLRSIYCDTPPSRVSIEYEAGFGPTAADIPRDLAQAVMAQSSIHFDVRSEMETKTVTRSPHMARIAARYRGVSA